MDFYTPFGSFFILLKKNEKYPDILTLDIQKKNSDLHFYVGEK